MRIPKLAAALLALVIGAGAAAGAEAGKAAAAAVQEAPDACADRMIRTAQAYLDKGYAIEASFLLADLKKEELPVDKKDAVAQLESGAAGALAAGSVRDAKENGVQCRVGDLYIDRAGKEVLFLCSPYAIGDIHELDALLRYDEVAKDADFRGGAIAVRQNGAYLYIDKAGKTLFEFKDKSGAGNESYNYTAAMAAGASITWSPS